MLGLFCPLWFIFEITRCCAPNRRRVDSGATPGQPIIMIWMQFRSTYSQKNKLAALSSRSLQPDSDIKVTATYPIVAHYPTLLCNRRHLRHQITDIKFHNLSATLISASSLRETDDFWKVSHAQRCYLLLACMQGVLGEIAGVWAFTSETSIARSHESGATLCRNIRTWQVSR